MMKKDHLSSQETLSFLPLMDLIDDENNGNSDD